MIGHALWRRIRRAWGDGGLMAVLGSIVQRLYLHNSAIWHERDLAKHIPDLRARFAIRIVLDDPMGTAEWLRARPHDATELSVAVARDHLLARAHLPGGPVAYVKAGWGDVWISDFQRSIRFPPDTAFIYDTYVDPLYRRRRIGLALLAAVIRELRARRFGRVFCHIPEWNLASRRLYKSLGFVARRRIH
jgi:ribosomal protein S18 acetylase RimI-like enzyme